MNPNDLSSSQAHAAILAARSEVFATELNSGMMEARTGVITIAGVHPLIFKVSGRCLEDILKVQWILFGFCFPT